MARPKKIHVVLSKQGNQWLASASQDKSLSISGHNTRSARLRVQNMIKERYGNVEIEFEVALPAEKQAKLDEHLAQERLFQSLVHAIPASRVAIAEELLGEHLTQQEVADLMGLSQGHLAVILKREATAGVPVKPSTRRTSQT